MISLVVVTSTGVHWTNTGSVTHDVGYTYLGRIGFYGAVLLGFLLTQQDH